MKIIEFIYKSFYKFSKLLGSNDPIESSKLYFVWMFAGFSIPMLSYFLYLLIGKGNFILWIILSIGYCLLINYLIRKFVLNKISADFNKKSKNWFTELNSILSVVISILLLFGSVVLGFLCLKLLSICSPIKMPI